MPKLHELLAVGNNLEAQAAKTRADLMATFHSKRHLFEQKLVTFKPSEDGAATVTEAQSDIQTTVRKEIAWISEIINRDIDLGYQVDIANTKAVADIVTEGDAPETIAKGIPATSLLQLEKRLKQLHELIVAIPTLDPAKGFSMDATREEGIYKAREVNKTRTKKIAEVLVRYPATKEHPAQTEVVGKDVPVGTVLEQEWSAMLTPAIKGDLLDRCEVLTRAVKRARSRANELDMDVAANKIGKRLLDYVFKPLL